MYKPVIGSPAVPAGSDISFCCEAESVFGPSFPSTVRVCARGASIMRLAPVICVVEAFCPSLKVKVDVVLVDDFTWTIKPAPLTAKPLAAGDEEPLVE